MAAPTLTSWLRPRARLVATAVGAGIVGGAVATLLLAVRYPFAFVSTQVFAVGALLFGFGLLGWSGSVMAGRGIEAMQEHLDTRTEWSEEDSRRAMTRIASAGLGVMVSVPSLAVVTP